MTPRTSPLRRRGRVWMLIAVLAVFGAALLVGTRSLMQTDCELCVTFRGQTQCRRGSGANEREAQRAAQRAACAVMAFGMDESIACDNVPPLNVRCPAR